jgi:hypothetical protein
MFIALPFWFARVAWIVAVACAECAAGTWRRAVEQYDEMWREGELPRAKEGRA